MHNNLQLTYRLLLAMLLACICLTNHPAYAKNKQVPKPPSTQELIESAAKQIQGGAYAQGVASLSALNPKEQGVDQARYFNLLGIGQMGVRNYAAARDNFKHALDAGLKDPVVYRYLAEIHYQLKDYALALSALDKAAVNYRDFPSLLEIKTQAHWALEQKNAAWEAIGLTRQLFPQEAKYLKQQIVYALELSLFEHAAELAQQYLTTPQVKPEEMVTIGNALRLNRQLTQATQLLELARLRFPEHANIAKVLGHSYMDRGMNLAAANILEQAALINPEFINEASELHKNAGNLQHALFLNAQIGDQSKKLKQRLAILLGLKQYEMILYMESSLLRHRLLDDQNIRYALAYAAYSSGDFPKAKQHLAFVKEANLFKQATELQRLMQDCETQKSNCG